MGTPPSSGCVAMGSRPPHSRVHSAGHRAPGDSAHPCDRPQAQCGVPGPGPRPEAGGGWESARAHIQPHLHGLLGQV